MAPEQRRGLPPAAPHPLKRLGFRRTPLVMGILNVTPDSFSDGGRYEHPAAAVRQGLAMAAKGADLIDVGGESTRPGAVPVAAAEELRRVIPVIERLAPAVSLPISIDTWKADVARHAIAAGASVVNDVTALRGDPAMAEVIAQARTAVILMHMRGTARTMQQRPRYRDVVAEVRRFLAEAARRAQAAGIEARQILLDPGLGFGKTASHNLELLRSLEQFTALGFPVVIGPSRKSFIGQVLGGAPHERLTGTLACVAWAQLAGAHVVRVHDVQPAVQMIRMLRAIRERGPDAPWGEH